MKTLLLLRHAKSDWGDPALDDHERPLNERGQAAARRMGAHLAARQHPPEQILCSSARRTRETLEAIRTAAARTAEVAVEADLYLASRGALLARVRDVDDEVGILLLIGHNPGIAELAHGLAGRGEAEALAELRRKFPTAALATLRFDFESWAEVDVGTGHLEAFATPRQLKEQVD